MLENTVAARPAQPGDKLAAVISAASSPFIVAATLPVGIIAALTPTWPQRLALIALYLVLRAMGIAD